MSKGLKALKDLKECMQLEGVLDCINEERVNIIEKELKALEIIKKKRVIMMWLCDCKSIHEYNSLVIGKHMLTEEEYELLREVLK